jgi:hypothetical protein
MNGPTITSATRDGNKIIVTGTGFFDVPPTNPLSVHVFGPDENEVEVTSDPASNGEQLIRILTTPPAKPKDCYRVVVTVGAFPPAEGRACPKP